jgi:hypothetical protein
MWDIDQQGQEELDREFENFLAFVERTEQESKERLAKTGEKPRRILVGVDRISQTIAVVPIDKPDLAQGEGQDSEAGTPS